MLGHSVQLSESSSNNVNKSHLKINSPVGYTNACLINAQSLACHFDEFKHVCDGSNFHFIAVTETWLKGPKTHPSSSISLDQYQLIRNDRMSIKSNNKVKRAGGVALYVKKMKDVKCKIVERSSQKDQIEFIFVEVKYLKLNFSILVGVVYRPNCHVPFEDFETALSTILPKYENFLLLGDFNVDILRSSSDKLRFLDLLQPFDLDVLPSGATRVTDKSATQIDIFITNRKELFNTVKTRAIPTISDHDLVYTSLKIEAPQDQPEFLNIRNFNRIMLSDLLKDASLLPWDSMYSESDINSKLSIFNSCAIELLNKHAPELKVKITSNQWFDRDIDIKRSESLAAYLLWRSAKNRKKGDAYWENYRSLRNKFNTAKQKSKLALYNEKLDSSLPPKQFYQNLRKIGLLPTKSEKVISSYSAQDFNTHFTNLVSTPNLINLNYQSAAPFDQFSFQNIEEITVKKCYHVN